MRIHVLSERNSSSHLSWANNFEFEDVIASTCDATIISPHQFFAHTRWEPVTGRLRKGRYRKVERDAVGGDLLIVIAMGPPALRMLHAVPGWRERYEKVVAYVPDIYPPSHKMIDLRLAGQLDALFIGYSQMVDTVEKHVGIPTYHLQQAADVLAGLPRRWNRKIDISAFGRQPSGIVGAIAESFAWPQSDTVAWWSQGTIPYSKSPQLDRQAFLGLLRATRITLGYRFEDTHPGEYQGVSPFTARWFEAAASGTAMAGSQPSCPEGTDDTMVQTIPLPTDGRTACRVLSELLSTGVYQQWADGNFVLACRYHDWRHRLAFIFDTLKFQAPMQLQADLDVLRSEADRAQKT